MSDQVKFMNSYVDVTVASLHEYLNQILQYKTQIKVSADTIAALQSEIEGLRKEVENGNNERTEKESAFQKITELENTNTALQNKVGHLDTAINQIAEMKSIIINKDNEIASIRSELQTTISQKDNELNSLRSELETVKSLVTQKDSELNSLRTELEITIAQKEQFITSSEKQSSVELQSAKKVINKKKTTQDSSNVLLTELTKIDDF